VVSAQDTYTIQGHFPRFPNSKLELKGYNGLEQSILCTSKSKDDGTFTLSYPKEYVGTAQLYMNGAYTALLFLNNEVISIRWDDLLDKDGLQSNSQEYQAFLGGIKAFQDSEAKLAGLNYLVPLYAADSTKQKIFVNELDTVASAFPNYVRSLPKERFVRQYLLAKGLIEQMPCTVKTYTWRASQHVVEFMAIDFKALEHAGLYKELVQGYTNLVERFPLEEINLLLRDAIDKVIGELKHEPTLQQEIAQLWITYLESHSLFDGAAYLATKMLSDETCQLSDKSINLFEQYRKMAVGKTAPVIALEKNKKLSEIQSKYKLVVFGASWCPRCETDLPKLKEQYAALNQTYDLEIVYISIDTDKVAFENKFKNVPFTTYCDFKGWETQAAKDYHVYATPSHIIMDRNLNILVKHSRFDSVISFFK
jgi:thiol-disulfide isomerase/thioredoxin